jgi:hypothetical protein
MRPVGGELLHADGRTDVTGVIVAFRFCVRVWNTEKGTKIGVWIVNVKLELVLYNYYSNKMHTFFVIKITKYYNL